MPRRVPVALRIGVLAGVVLLALALAQSGAAVDSGPFQALAFLVMFLVVIPLHELGHAIVGALLGFRIVAINLGIGPELLAFDAFGTKVRLNLLPLGGMTLGLPRRDQGWAPLRQWLVSAGGPAANLLIYVLLRKVYGRDLDVEGAEHHFAAVAMWVNQVVAVTNLIPYKTGEGAASDGYSLLTIPFWGPKQREAARVWTEGANALEAMRRGDLAEAERLVGELRARHPDATGPMLLAGNVYHQRGDHEAARAVWREGLARETQPLRLNLFRNNVAWVDALIGDEAGLREADALSEAALVARPDQPAFAGTRGAVLLRLGRPAEALPLLQLSAAAVLERHNVGYTHALLASALAQLGRGAEARQELEAARRADPRCELLPRAEADLTNLAAGGSVAATVAPATPSPSGLAGVLARHGGVVRWSQLARAVAFVAVLAPPRALDDTNFPAVLAAFAVVFSPHARSLAILGACNLALGAVRLVAASGYGSGDPLPLWAALVPFALGSFALVLAPLRARLGPRPPSKGPVVLGWLLGLTALAAASKVVVDVGRMRAAWHASLTSALRQVDPPELGKSVALVGFAVVLAASRRRWARSLAVLPAGLVVAAAVGAWNARAANALVNRIPEDGAPLGWEIPRPPKPLRARQITASGFDPVVSPGGNAFLLRDIVKDRTAGARRVIRVGQFEGPLLEIDGDAGAFIDDGRLVVVRDRRNDGGAIEIAEIHPAAGPDPVWSRPLPELGRTQLVGDLEIDGRAVVLVGRVLGFKRPFVARAPLGRAGPVEIAEFPSAHPEADELLSTFAGSGAGAAGALVSRRRASPDGGAGDTAYVPWRERRGHDERDIELWLLRPEREILLAPHGPPLTCPRVDVGHPVLWCLAQTAGGSLLVKVDPGAAHLARVGRPISRQAWGARLGPSKLALVMTGDINVVDVGTRRGSWLHFPDTELDPTLARGGPLAAFSRAGEGEGANLVVYELP